MKLFVLAIDGLEFSLIRRWKLKCLLQREYGVFKIPSEYCIRIKSRWTDGKEEISPFTPIIWTSFLTGKRPTEHGIRELQLYLKIPVFLRYSKVAHRCKRLLNSGLSIFLGKLLNIPPRVLVDKKDIMYPTIFDVVKRSIAVYFMCYNEPTWLYNLISDTLKGDLAKAPKVLWSIYKLRRKKMSEALLTDWRLFGVYFEIADILGHIFINKKRLELLKVYLELNRLVKEIQNILPNNAALLVVTDHGMKPVSGAVGGVHTRYAFWSLNIKPPFEPKDFTDFFYIILELLSSNNL